MDWSEYLGRQGRYGDTMVAHINPREAAILQALGGKGSVNPRTGLREYWDSDAGDSMGGPADASSMGEGNSDPSSGMSSGYGSMSSVEQEQADKGHEEPKDQQDDDFEGQVHTPGPGGWGLDCRLAHGGDSLVIKRVRPAARTGHARSARQLAPRRPSARHGRRPGPEWSWLGPAPRRSA